MRKITLIMAYYLNAGMLKKQCEYIGAYPKEVRDNLTLIVIDDGSPVPAVLEPIPGVETHLYRTLKDIAWNQDFCRNLGVSKAKTEWVFLTDIDHLVLPETLYSLMTKEVNPKVAYRFNRVDLPDMKPRHLHPNTWFLTKNLYNKIGGYDERLAGYYGTDGDFRDRLLKFAHIEQLPLPIIRVGREHIPDASTTTYERKKPEDGIAINKIKAARGLARPKTLTFKWEKVV